MIIILKSLVDYYKMSMWIVLIYPTNIPRWEIKNKCNSITTIIMTDVINPLTFHSCKKLVLVTYCVARFIHNMKLLITMKWKNPLVVK